MFCDACVGLWPFDRSQNLRPNCENFKDPFGQSVTVLGTSLGVCVIIYTINCVLVCMRPKMTMEIGFKKWNKCLMSGLPTDSPLALFWDC